MDLNRWQEDSVLFTSSFIRLESSYSQCVVLASPGSFLKCKFFSTSTSLLSQKHSGWDLAVCVLTSPPGDSDALSSLRNTGEWVGVLGDGQKTPLLGHPKVSIRLLTRGWTAGLRVYEGPLLSGTWGSCLREGTVPFSGMG